MLTTFKILTGWAATPNACVIYPNSMIYHPVNWTHYAQFFQELHWVLELSVSLCPTLRRKFSASDLMLIGGDFDSRTGTDPDYINQDKSDLSFLSGDYELDAYTVSRNNEDVSINYFCQQLLKHCITAKLRNLNGRTRDDLQGHLTSFLFQGWSTVDSVLVCKSLLKSSLIQYLSVQDFNLVCDQKPILLKIPINNLLGINKDLKNYILEDRPPKDHWDNSLKKVTKNT